MFWRRAFGGQGARNGQQRRADGNDCKRNSMDDENPTICDNGTEDYFGGAWNFGAYDVVPNSNEIEFSTPFLGLPKVEHNGKINNKFSMYRFHIIDCIGFEKNMKVTVDTIGWELDHSKYKHTTEKVASVAYYYQVKK